jgi:hypothetical protein
MCVLPCRNLRFLESLLAEGLPLEVVCPKTGETPLLMAINFRDLEVGGNRSRLAQGALAKSAEGCPCTFWGSGLTDLLLSWVFRCSADQPFTSVMVPWLQIQNTAVNWYSICLSACSAGSLHCCWC